jgi:hypothetical protein
MIPMQLSPLKIMVLAIFRMIISTPWRVITILQKVSFITWMVSVTFQIITGIVKICLDLKSLNLFSTPELASGESDCYTIFVDAMLIHLIDYYSIQKAVMYNRVAKIQVIAPNGRLYEVG